MKYTIKDNIGKVIVDFEKKIIVYDRPSGALQLFPSMVVSFDNITDIEYREAKFLSPAAISLIICGKRYVIGSNKLNATQVNIPKNQKTEIDGILQLLLKECSLDGFKAFDRQDVPKVDEFPETEGSHFGSREHRMRCNVCGKVFCYTDSDIRANQSHAKWATAHAVSSMLGTKLDYYGQTKQMQNEVDKIIDYSKCPACNSKDLTELSEKEWEIELQTSKNQSETSIIVDDIKKFKELLDSGVITQEEFDAKKKQLLGL